MYSNEIVSTLLNIFTPMIFETFPKKHFKCLMIIYVCFSHSQGGEQSISTYIKQDNLMCSHHSNDIICSALPIICKMELMARPWSVLYTNGKEGKRILKLTMSHMILSMSCYFSYSGHSNVS